MTPTRSSRGYTPCHAGHPDHAGRLRGWLTAPTEQALKLQRPLPDEALRVVMTGERKDEAIVA